MVTEVYADLLFLINFSMDYLCLYICARVLHLKTSLWRMIISASVGGVYSVLSLLFNANTLIGIIIDVCVCIIICAIAFAKKESRVSSTLLCAFLYIGISMMTGGTMTAIFYLLDRLNLPIDAIEEDGISPYIFIILAIISGIITLKSGQILSKRSSITTCTLKITLNGKEAVFLALSDSGNLVKDPISNKPVIVVDRKSLSKIADVTLFDDFAQGKSSKIGLYNRMRLIPIKTAGGSSMLVATFPEKVLVEVYDKKQNRDVSIDLDALIAPSDIGNIADGCNAIIPAEIIKF